MFAQSISMVAAGLSIASSIKNLLASAPSLADITAALSAEVGVVFFLELESATFRESVGTAQAAHDFLAINYGNLQINGADKGRLYEELDRNAAVHLQDLIKQTVTLKEWASADNEANKREGAKSLLSRSLSLQVCIYTLICTFQRELAETAPTPQLAASHRADMKDYGSMAWDRIVPSLNQTLYDHQNAVTLTEVDNELPSGVRAIGIKDTWFSNDVIAATQWDGDDHDQVDGYMQEARRLYGCILGSGSWDPIRNELLSQFEAIPRHPDTIEPFRPIFLPRANIFSDWFAQNKAALSSLKNLN